MSNALDYVRNNCGIAGEEVAEMVDALERQRDELLAALEVLLTGNLQDAKEMAQAALAKVGDSGTGETT